MRRRVAWAAAALVLLLLAGAGALVARRGVRSWWWDGVAGRPMSDDERAAFGACGTVEFGVLAKALVTDEPAPCGEAWVVREGARHARGSDQAAWLAERVVAPATPEGGRLRGALALALAGRVPPLEPALLRPRLPDERWGAFRDLLPDAELAALLGPAGEALGLAERLATGEASEAEALPALVWLAAVGAPEADAAVVRAVAAVSGADPAVAERLGERRGRGAPLAGGGAPDPEGLARASCRGDGCARALLQAVLRERRVEGFATGPAADPVPAELGLDAFFLALGAADDERAALAWEVGALRRWVDGHPERLHRLWSRPGRGPAVRLAWDGAGTPFLAAVVVRAVAPEAIFRADRPGSVWAELDGAWGARSCVGEGLEPPGEDWPAAALLARAAREARTPGGERLAVRLDPSLPAPPPRGDPVARALGEELAPLAPLAGAEGDRARVTEGFCE